MATREAKKNYVNKKRDRFVQSWVISELVTQ